jgi:hypothetical protein
VRELVGTFELSRFISWTGDGSLDLTVCFTGKERDEWIHSRLISWKEIIATLRLHI